MAEVVEALEGSIAPIECISQGPDGSIVCSRESGADHVCPTKLLWTNPHARVQVESKDQSGKVESWDFELGPPTVLMRQGWNRNSLKPGQIVTVSGFLSKDEPHVANARTVTLADGRQVFAGSSSDTQTPAGSNAPQQ